MNKTLGLEIKNKMEYNSKERFGKDFWAEHKALSLLEKAEIHEQRKNWWQRIQDDSDIAEIYLEINGCGDDGSIEKITLINNDGCDIYPRYLRDTVSVPADNNSEDNPAKIPFEKQYGAPQFSTIAESKEYIANVVTGLETYTYITDTRLHDSSNGKVTTYQLVFDTFDHKMNWNQEWLHWGDEACNQYAMEFPNIRTWHNMFEEGNKNPIKSLIQSVYSLLPGGWEINEGSNSVVSIKNNSAGDLQMNVSYEQHVMSSETHEFTVQNSVNLRDKINSYVDNNDIKKRTLNLSNKKHNATFYKLADLIEDNLYGEYEGA